MRLFHLNPPLMDSLSEGGDLSADLALLSGEPESPEPGKQPDNNLPGSGLDDEDEDSNKEDSEEVPDPGTEDLDEEDNESDESENKSPITNRPSIKQIKEKFPTLFKEFPQFKDIYFREQEYSKMFPTVADAHQAAEDSEAFSNIRDGVMSGNIGSFFKAVQEADENALANIAPNLLPALNKISPEVHYQAVLPILENLTRTLYAEGAKYGDSEIGNNLKNSALHLSQFLFGDKAEDVATGKFSNLTKQTPKVDPERERWEAERATTFMTETQDGMLSGLKGAIMARGQHNKLLIDPEGVLPDFTKDAMVERIMQRVGEQLEADPVHKRHMQNLWKQARQSGYKGDWKSRLTTAYLERAKSLIPGIRSRLVAEVYGTASVKSNKQVDKAKALTSRKEPGQGGKESIPGPKVFNPKQVDYRKTSDMDILAGKVTLR